MPTLSESLPYASRLQLALRTYPPSRIAVTFASFAGQFANRASFDALAREVSALYARESPERGHAFRAQLDRRLCERDHGPVPWDVEVAEERPA